MRKDLDEQIAESGDEPSAEVAEIMENHDLTKDEAERAQELVEDLGLDEDTAVELAEVL